MKTWLIGLVMAAAVHVNGVAGGAEEESSIHTLAQRVVPSFADQITFEELPASNGKDVFELERVKDQIIIRGNNVSAQAFGLNWFLKYYCNTSVSWYAADPIELPSELPQIKKRVRRECAVESRFFLNYCTFGYTMPWWQWNDWERLIDWMALNGVNMPLAITGQEAIWQKVWMDFGLTDEEVRSYFTGPAHLPWHRMGNIDHWDGPLPQSYIDHQLKLQKQILARERELGMTPVLPGFAGHVPEALKRLRPEAKTTHLNKKCWGGFTENYTTHFLDPEDPLFATIQKAFLEEQTKQFGTDHIYGVDPFNEMVPPSWEPKFLSRVSKAIYASLAEVDPEAIWLQMSWMFFHQGHDWLPERMEALITAPPQDKMVLLDYYCENVQLYQKTESFYGQPFLWCYLGNFGGNTAFAGDLKETDARMSWVLRNPKTRNLMGVGSTLEAMDVNPVMYEFVLEKVWQSKPADLEKWIKAYARRRAGSTDPELGKAWTFMLKKIYCEKSMYGRGTLMRTRPSLETKGSSFARTEYAYDNEDLFTVWGKMLKAEKRDHDAYQFDLINVASQALENSLISLHDEIIKAWKDKDLEAFDKQSTRFLEQIADIERLATTRTERLMGKWIAEARAFGINDSEKDVYEKNARTLLTTWGFRGNRLNDYANRAWSGLIEDYYLQRWKLFVSALRSSLTEGTEFNEKSVNKQLMDFEEKWVNKKQAYATAPQGDSYEVAKNLYGKYTNHE